MNKCSEHRAPTIWTSGRRRVCIIEWLIEYLDGVAINDLIPGNPFQLVMSNGGTFPVQSISRFVDDQLQTLLADPAFLLYELEGMGLAQAQYLPPSLTSDGLGESNSQIQMEFTRNLSILPEHPGYSPVVVMVDPADVMALMDDQMP